MIRLSISIFAIVISFFTIANLIGVESVAPIQASELRPQIYHLTPETQRQIRCLAKNIYFEARNEPVLGQAAVAFVTINRVNSQHFPDTICGVVEQRTTRVCQFSWFCEETPKHLYQNNILTLRNDSVYNRIHALAIHVYANYERMEDPTKGSLFYHADYVNPKWRNVEYETTIGRHIFYRLKEI